MGALITRLNRFKVDYIDPPIMTTREVKEEHWITSQLMRAGFTGDKIRRLHLDSKYWVCCKKEFEDWISWDWTNKKQYVSEEYDCDNFAFSFKARCDRKIGINAVGLVIDYSGGHAYNLVIFSDAAPELFEPQGDRWVEGGKGMYKMVDGYIIL